MSIEPKLPTGWVFSTIGEVCEPSQYGYTAKASSSGLTHYLRTTDITSGLINWASVPYCDIPESEEPKYLLNDGDVVISRAGSVGYSCLILNPAKSVFASYLIRFRPIILPKYFSYFLNTPTYWESIGERSLGIAVQNVNATNLSEIQIPIAPKAEQTRIVEKLEELFSDLDAGVAELKAAQKKLVQYRQSLLKAAVEGALTAEWRSKNKPEENGAQLLERILKERRARWEEKQLAKFKEQGKTPPKGWQDKYPEPVQPDTANLPELPEGWVWATLSQVGWLDRGRSQHRPRNAPHLYGGPYPFVQTGDIRHAGTFISNVETAYSEAGLAQSRLWPAGTMCITIAANIGKTAILSIEACFPDSVVGFLPATDDVSNRFVEFFMRSIQQRLEDEAPATAQKNINLEILEKVAIPIPPIHEQKRIVEIADEALTAATEQNRAIEFALTQAVAQRKNILKSAFSGQLVAQDPNDEPASLLLEQIREERKKQSAQPKQRKAKVTKEISIVTRKLIDVLTEAGDWLPAQEAFRRCGIADSATTDQIEEIYSELRRLDKENVVVAEPVTDANGIKQYDRLRIAVKG